MHVRAYQMINFFEDISSSQMGVVLFLNHERPIRPMSILMSPFASINGVVDIHISKQLPRMPTDAREWAPFLGTMGPQLPDRIHWPAIQCTEGVPAVALVLYCRPRHSESKQNGKYEVNPVRRDIRNL